MNNYNTDDTFLARWISGDLSPEEQKAFEASPEYSDYKMINEAAQKLSTPSYNQKSAFERLQNQIQKPQDAPKSTIKLIPNWAYGVAASIALILGYFYFTDTTESFETGYGEQLAIILPDNSKVKLNANSSLEYSEKDWDNNRTLDLNGEAYFEVEKGSAFKVNTAEGVVEVLGTKFVVTTHKDHFETHCFEGKVKATSKHSNAAVLTQGKAFRDLNNNVEQWSFSSSEPSWVRGESSFENAPLSQVVLALENQFNIKVDKSTVNLNERFTGSFSHEDLNIALKSIFVPMKISYTFKGDKHIVLVK